MLKQNWCRIRWQPSTEPSFDKNHDHLIIYSRKMLTVPLNWISCILAQKSIYLFRFRQNIRKIKADMNDHRGKYVTEVSLLNQALNFLFLSFQHSFIVPIWFSTGSLEIKLLLFFLQFFLRYPSDHQNMSIWKIFFPLKCRK